MIDATERTHDAGDLARGCGLARTPLFGRADYVEPADRGNE
jgi:hypothetical protein